MVGVKKEFVSYRREISNVYAPIWNKCVRGNQVTIIINYLVFRSGVPQNFHLNLLIRAIVDPDGNQTIFSRALLDADFEISIQQGCGRVL